jgi:hypothetical protein
MAFIEVKTSHTPKAAPVFGTATDLAHGLISSWVFNHLDDLHQCDIILAFYHDEVLNANKKNFITKKITVRKLTKYQKHLHHVLISLQFLRVEIDALIGHNAYLQAGIKMKIKNKKQFDDILIDVKEITIMLAGLLLFLKKDLDNDELQLASSVYANELEILSTITSNYSIQYYQSIITKLNSFIFK